MSDFDKIIRSHFDEEDDNLGGNKMANWQKLSARLATFEAANPLPPQSPQIPHKGISIFRNMTAWRVAAATLLGVSSVFAWNWHVAELETTALKSQIAQQKQQNEQYNTPPVVKRDTVYRTVIIEQKTAEAPALKPYTQRHATTNPQNSSTQNATVQNSADNVHNWQNSSNYKDNNSGNNAPPPINIKNDKNILEQSPIPLGIKKENLAENNAQNVLKNTQNDINSTSNDLKNTATTAIQNVEMLNFLGLKKIDILPIPKYKLDLEMKDFAAKPIIKMQKPRIGDKFDLAVGLTGASFDNEKAPRDADAVLGVGAVVGVRHKSGFGIVSNFERTRMKFEFKERPMGIKDFPKEPRHEPHEKLKEIEGVLEQNIFSINAEYVLSNRFWLNPKAFVGYSVHKTKENTPLFEFEDELTGLSVYKKSDNPMIPTATQFWLVGLGVEKDFNRLRLSLSGEMRRDLNQDTPFPQNAFVLRGGVAVKLF